MKQPELGMKVSELRQQKGLTQEQLAERCEVSTRTVQRIESGEVDPRLFTLTNLGEALDFDFTTGDLENEHLWLAVLHLSSTLCILPPRQPLSMLRLPPAPAPACLPHWLSAHQSR